MWLDIEGHDEVAERFRRTLRAGRLASTYLFVGSAGIGKRLFAWRLAQALLCERHAEEELQTCDSCSTCRLMRSGNHPDLLEICLPKDKNVLPISLFVGERDHRQQAGLCHHLSLKPSLGSRRIAIIDDADHFSQEAANCLLKSLEEPPPRSLLILIGTSPSRQLPTIRSRSQLVRFAPLDEELVRRLILENQIVDDPSAAAQLAADSAGSLERARELADPDYGRFQQQLADALQRTCVDSVRLSRSVLEFVEAAGTEAAARRQRLRLVLQAAAQTYRQQMRTDLAEDSADKVDHCLRALEYVDRNANQTTLAHWWAEGLSGE